MNSYHDTYIEILLKTANFGRLRCIFTYICRILYTSHGSAQLRNRCRKSSYKEVHASKAYTQCIDVATHVYNIISALSHLNHAVAAHVSVKNQTCFFCPHWGVSAVSVCCFQHFQSMIATSPRKK